MIKAHLPQNISYENGEVYIKVPNPADVSKSTQRVVGIRMSEEDFAKMSTEDFEDRILKPAMCILVQA